MNNRLKIESMDYTVVKNSVLVFFSNHEDGAVYKYELPLKLNYTSGVQRPKRDSVSSLSFRRVTVCLKFLL